MLDGPVLGVSHTQCEVVLNPPHAATVLCSQRQSLSGVWRFGRLVFSQQKGRERALRVTRGAGMRVSRVKANVMRLAANCACVCMRACVFGCCTVRTGPRLILKCQSPTAAHCSCSLQHFISLHHYLFSLFPSLWLTEVGKANGDVQECGSSSETENDHI